MCPACWTRCRRGGLAQALAREADVEGNHEDRGKSLNIRLAGSYSWVGIEASGVDIQPNGIGGGEDLELAIEEARRRRPSSNVSACAVFGKVVHCGRSWFVLLALLRSSFGA